MHARLSKLLAAAHVPTFAVTKTPEEMAVMQDAVVQRNIHKVLLKGMSRLEVLSSDEDDSNMSQADAYRKSLIRQRKSAREVSKLQRDANAKDAVQPPKKDIPVSRQLSSDTDYLAVLMFLMIVEERVRQKVWSVAVESWAFLQFVPGSDAHTSFHNNLKTSTLITRLSATTAPTKASSQRYLPSFSVTTRVLLQS
jgi:hypothetical protein